MNTYHLFLGWQKYNEDAVSQEKSASPTTKIFSSSTNSITQQGWNTVGGKSVHKSSPWGPQNRTFPLQRHIEISLIQQAQRKA